MKVYCVSYIPNSPLGVPLRESRCYATAVYHRGVLVACRSELYYASHLKLHYQHPRLGSLSTPVSVKMDDPFYDLVVLTVPQTLAQSEKGSVQHGGKEGVYTLHQWQDEKTLLTLPLSDPTPTVSDLYGHGHCVVTTFTVGEGEVKSGGLIYDPQGKLAGVMVGAKRQRGGKESSSTAQGEQIATITPFYLMGLVQYYSSSRIRYSPWEMGGRKTVLHHTVDLPEDTVEVDGYPLVDHGTWCSITLPPCPSNPRTQPFPNGAPLPLSQYLHWAGFSRHTVTLLRQSGETGRALLTAEELLNPVGLYQHHCYDGYYTWKGLHMTVELYHHLYNALSPQTLLSLTERGARFHLTMGKDGEGATVTLLPQSLVQS